jgi:hypothetical protein
VRADAELLRALDAAPRPVTFWWRDDDAGRDHPRLAALLDLADARTVPVALAVVPSWLEDACAERVRRSPSATVLQHGVAHADHAARPAKKIELGGTADRGLIWRGLQAGRGCLAAAFAERFLPVLVPPWNRIAPDVVPTLTDLGFSGLSAFGQHGPAWAAPGLRRVDTHLDLVAWREGNRPLTLAESTERLAGLVRACPGEPIGILSHHLAMGLSALGALDQLLALVQDHPRGRLAAAAALFGGA